MPLIVKIAYKSKVLFLYLSAEEELSALENYSQARETCVPLPGLQMTSYVCVTLGKLIK